MTQLPDGVEPPRDWKHNQRIAWEDGYLAAMHGDPPEAMPDLGATEEGAWARGHAVCTRNGDSQGQDPEFVRLVQGREQDGESP